VTKQNRSVAGAELRMRKGMGFLSVQAMTKDSASGMSWR
jgi:hypothetical protein